jgi:hypothetical protein
VNKLIIDPETRERIRGALAARAEAERRAAEPLHPKVKAFWEAQERIIPPWEIESAQERKERDEASGRGCWTG